VLVGELEGLEEPQGLVDAATNGEIATREIFAE
jgi:hypothetical protein